MIRVRHFHQFREVLLVAALCLTYTVFRTLTAQGFLYYVRDTSMPFMRIFPGELLTHGLWGLFFFMIRGLVQAFRRHIRRPGARLAAHALMYVLTPLLLRTLSLWLYDVLDLWKSIPGNIQGVRLLGVAFSRWLFYDYILYAVILGSILFFDAFKREKQYQIARLQTDLRRVTFRNLSEELRPQFVLSLFDQLAAQIGMDPDKAGRMVTRFGVWLRAMQDMTTSLLVPLKDELKLFNAYLDIERMRHGQRLSVDMQWSDAALAWPVPPLLLQPLVETALGRTACDGATAVAVAVSGRVEDGFLKISLSIGGAVPPGEAHGRERAAVDVRMQEKLAALYGEEFSWNACRSEGNVSQITLRLPRLEFKVVA